jgi:hypothetical protein
MTQQIINTGTGPGAGNGDPLRTAFTEINSNFTELYANVANLTSSVTTVAGRTGNVILTVNDIVGYINPNVAIAVTMPTYTGNISAGNITATGIVKTGVYTVSSLPSASTVGAGARAFVTDANTIVFGSALTGSAGNAVPVFSNGTTWRIG